MRHGLRVLGALLVCTAVAALAAANAGAYVYWSVTGTSDGTTIGRANLDASGVNHALVHGASGPVGLIVYGSHLYWANSQTNSIGRSNLDGTGANATFIPSATSGNPGSGPLVTSLTTDGTYLYWTDGYRYVGRARLDGSSKAQPKFIDIGGPDQGPFGIAYSGGTLYLGEFDEIASVPATGGTPQQLVALPGSSAALSLAASGGYLYGALLNLNSSSSVLRVELNGQNLKLDYVPNLTYPIGVAVDATHVYWADYGGSVNAVGRATLGANQAITPQSQFIPEPGRPGGVAVDARLDPTLPALSCTPTTVAAGKPASCAVTIRDTASSAPPTGQVNFASNASTFFSGSSSSCTLVRPFGGGAPACTIGVVPLNAGSTQIVASYPGDAIHYPSQTTFTICVGKTGPCQTKPPVRCVVPKLRGKTLARAKTLLSSAHCRLGKVHRPRHGKHLVVSRQSFRPGSKLRAGAKVGVTLVARRRR